MSPRTTDENHIHLSSAPHTRAKWYWFITGYITAFFPSWWMVNGMWDDIDKIWLIDSKHLLCLTFSPNKSNSFYIRHVKRLFQWHLSSDTYQGLSNICALLTYVWSADKPSDSHYFFFFFFSLVSQFNFVGKLLGPRGNSMKRLQEETGVKMSILGKGSMRDKEKVRRVLICAEMWLFGCSERNIYRN